jgi:AcrR family transcriptional regulator
VCRRTGASTKTAYRRWANKDELLTAALRRAVEREVDHEIDVDMSKGLRLALVTALQRQAESLWWSPNLVVALIVASRVDGDLGSIVRQVIRQSGTERARAVLSSARAW